MDFFRDFFRDFFFLFLKGVRHVFEVMFDHGNGVFGWQIRLTNSLKGV